MNELNYIVGSILAGLVVLFFLTFPLGMIKALEHGECRMVRASEYVMLGYWAGCELFKVRFSR